MNKKYFVYALVVTLITTTVSWSRMFASTTGTGRGSTWSSGGGGYYGGGGGHK